MDSGFLGYDAVLLGEWFPHQTVQEKLLWFLNWVTVEGKSTTFY
jgi:hypothetical protein